MTTLLIDIGNTRLKWGLDTDEGFQFGGHCSSSVASVESLFNNEWKNLHPQAVLVSNVSSEEIGELIQTQAESRWAIQTTVLVTPKKGCGIYNSYASPEKMGSDRWAAMVAGFQHAKSSVCIVGCGTAVTVDVIAVDGRHLGGVIIPGYDLMQECLQTGTMMSFSENQPLSVTEQLGQSTESCIQLGVRYAVSSMVKNLYQKLQTEMPDIKLILAGGAADVLDRQLALPSTIEPHLVLMGLSIINRSDVMEKSA